MAGPKVKRVKVKLLKGVRIAGKHVDKGKRIEVDQSLANDMVNANQAVLDEDEEEEHKGPLEPEQMGVQVVNPTNGDPGHREIPPAEKPKVVDKRDEKKK